MTRPEAGSQSDEALIFNVQRFSIHDGPGIRTTVFFKGCPLRCRWCHNPESLKPRPELAFRADRCRESSLCLPACPLGALEPGSQRVDRQQCNGCGACLESCPYGALEIVGRWVTVDALLAEVMRDEAFYRKSGGGITLSGGEATLQLPFVSRFLDRCDEQAIAVGLQTCGAFHWDALEPLAIRFRFIYFDLKVLNPGRHRELTGAGNHTILDNARCLVAAKAPVEFRMPVVPGYTDDATNLNQVAGFLHKLGVPRLHLLTYHAMGEIKSARLGWPLPALNLDHRSEADAHLAKAADWLEDRGIEIVRPS